MGTTAWNNRLNLDGVLIFSTHQPCHSYTQLYRNGIIEVVQGRILAHEYERRLVIPSIAYERDILTYLPRCLGVLQEIGSEGPVVLALTLTKTRGLTMGVDSFYYETGYPIDSDNIILPETVVEDLSTPANRILKPMFDLIWNACGFVGSSNFDADGNWTPRRR
jgi:hypothetical protein